jgi:hypothetical protein
MKQFTLLLGATLSVSTLMSPGALAQSADNTPDVLMREAPLLRDNGMALKIPDVDRRSTRFRLFGMSPGFLYSPVGLEDDDDTTESGDSTSTIGEDVTDGRVQIVMGMNNPYFDLRRPGDPAGLGYYRVHSQYQMFDSGNTGLNVGLQGVTPAGQVNGGIENGPTVIRPSLGWYHDRGDGTAFQGFISKDFRSIPRSKNEFGHSVQYGMGMLWPAPEKSPVRFNGFVEVLGHYRYGDPTVQRSPNVQVVPGVYWWLDATTWVALGLLQPLEARRPDVGQWQLTCSWQF